MDNKYYSFKQLFWACLFFTIPFSFLESLLALFNLVPVDFNNIPRYGLIGFIIPILFIPFIGFLFGGFCWVALNFGTFLYNKFFKLIKKK